MQNIPKGRVVVDKNEEALDHRFQRIENELPNFAARSLRWLREPSLGPYPGGDPPYPYWLIRFSPRSGVLDVAAWSPAACSRHLFSKESDRADSGLAGAPMGRL